MPPLPFRRRRPVLFHTALVVSPDTTPERGTRVCLCGLLANQVFVESPGLVPFLSWGASPLPHFAFLKFGVSILPPWACCCFHGCVHSSFLCSCGPSWHLSSFPLQKFSDTLSLTELSAKDCFFLYIFAFFLTGISFLM